MGGVLPPWVEVLARWIGVLPPGIGVLLPDLEVLPRCVGVLSLSVGFPPPWEGLLPLWVGFYFLGRVPHPWVEVMYPWVFFYSLGGGSTSQHWGSTSLGGFCLLGWVLPACSPARNHKRPKGQTPIPVVLFSRIWPAA